VLSRCRVPHLGALWAARSSFLCQGWETTNPAERSIIIRSNMYSPKFNQVSDRSILIEAMRAYSFAILFGQQSSPELPVPLIATHLPLVVKDEGEHGLIEGHFAKANRHWQALAGRETLVVFPDRKST